MASFKPRYDALVIGGGIAGMQAALDLGEQGFEVLLIEKQPSIGGIMVGLNKVFPTLDCSSCICTPRMAESAHHPRIQLQTYSEVARVKPHKSGFTVQVKVKPRYIDMVKCIGCGECELVCPVEVPHEFDCGYGARRAVYIPHGNAIPQKALIDLEHCIYCDKCSKACPTDAVDYLQREQEQTVEVGAVILATGLGLTPMELKPEYGGGRYPNVLSSMAMERIQSSNGPFGRVLRPSDGKIPSSIAYVQCAGSRDRSIGVPYCSRVCCMYALKQALLLRHYLHDVAVTIYHMDIRAFGKGYEQFYRRVMAEGVSVVKGKVARITEVEDHDLLLRLELVDEGRVVERRHDLIVLSQGVLPGWHTQGVIDVAEADDGFVFTPDGKINPSFTTMPGVFVGGVAAGPKDIPDAIVEAGEAAMAAANFLQSTGFREGAMAGPAVA